MKFNNCKTEVVHISVQFKSVQCIEITIGAVSSPARVQYVEPLIKDNLSKIGSPNVYIIWRFIMYF